MPPISLHMVLARDVAQSLGRETLQRGAGPYLLGATTPDIRVITRQDRFSTHYFDLNGPDHQDSVGQFLKANIQLVDQSLLNDETRAFVAGYISHLAMDEEYIRGVYRRFFAQHDELGGKIRANVMDRLLQFDMERTYGDPEVKHAISEALACTVETIDCGFVDTETLERWRQVSADIAVRNMDWERMRGMIANHLRYAGLEEGETLTGFLDSLPELLDETIAHITDAEVAGFVDRATSVAAEAVERYLCG
ncbi:MAG TPA: zinc dependent phospholipase C family protein [Tepidiformaceae bacterium]|nr:zinc dependent phospholipase C family protein [Tepidiformaceae bacterium]